MKFLDAIKDVLNIFKREKTTVRKKQDCPGSGTIPWGFKLHHVNGKLHREDGPAKETLFFGVYKGEASGFKKWFHEGRLHRDGAPAVEEADGAVAWYQHGLLHKEDGPAIEKANGIKEWWIKGRLHRKDGPAVDRKKLKKWYRNGRLHREDGPAIEYHYGTEKNEVLREWWIRGKRHRIDGPAIEIGPPSKREWEIREINRQRMLRQGHDFMGDTKDPLFACSFVSSHDRPINRTRYFGDKEWWIKGKLHREDAPATERIDGTKRWYRHGRLHRENGPAVEYSHGSREWWAKGQLHRKNEPAVELAIGWVIYQDYNSKLGSDPKHQNYNFLFRTVAKEIPASSDPKMGKIYRENQYWIKGCQVSAE